MVPFALGINPFAFRDERIVNPIDSPRFHFFKYFKLRAVGLYLPPSVIGSGGTASHGHAPPNCNNDDGDILFWRISGGFGIPHPQLPPFTELLRSLDVFLLFILLLCYKNMAYLDTEY